MPADLDIQPLTPDRLPDLAALFEQGGDPKWCWYKWQVDQQAVRRPISGAGDDA